MRTLGDGDKIDPNVGTVPLLSFLILAFLPNEAKKRPEGLPVEEAEVGVRTTEGKAIVSDREGGPPCRFRASEG